MDLLLPLIWLLGCFMCYTNSAKVIRLKDYDKIIPNTCVNSCRQHVATCTNKSSKCCKECRCTAIGATFYKNNSAQTCVLNPNKNEGCKYFIHGKKWIQLQRDKVMEVGTLNHQEVKLFSYKCTITKIQYWNLLKWKDLNDAKKSFEIYQKTDHFIKLNIPERDVSLYEGYLIKLEIDCINKEREKSCLIIKILGERKYDANTESKIIIPTKKTVTTTKKMEKKKKKNMLIVVIIAGSAAVLLIIVGIIIWWCWKRRRKTNGNGDASKRELLSQRENPDYQNPDRMSGRHSSEINSSANNLTYLQPVDAGLPRNRQGTGNHQKKKKDPNYDYPDINLHMSKKSGYQRPHDDESNEKPIYAEVTELKRPGHDYSDPDSFIKHRSGTEITGVPGYQPPRGPFSEGANSSTYSSLGALPTEESSNYQALLETSESEKTSQPPSPHYAEVESEEATEIHI